jgi:hypothetical protein
VCFVSSVVYRLPHKGVFVMCHENDDWGVSLFKVSYLILLWIRCLLDYELRLAEKLGIYEEDSSDRSRCKTFCATPMQSTVTTGGTVGLGGLYWLVACFSTATRHSNTHHRGVLCDTHHFQMKAREQFRAFSYAVYFALFWRRKSHRIKRL